MFGKEITLLILLRIERSPLFDPLIFRNIDVLDEVEKSQRKRGKNFLKSLSVSRSRLYRQDTRF